MRATKKNLDDYISRCVENACTTKGVKNDVQWDYRIIEDMLIFCISSKSRGVRILVENRLLRNLKKNFGLSFHLAYPGHSSNDSKECICVSKFELRNPDDVSPNHSIDKWNVSGKSYVLTSVLGNRPVEELGQPHVTKLVNAGYDYDNQSWEMFLEAYRLTYGQTPLECFLKCYKENQRYYDARESYFRNKHTHGCGYYSVCLEHDCPCSPTAKVNKGFDINVWDRMSDELSSATDEDEFGW